MCAPCAVLCLAALLAVADGPALGSSCLTRASAPDPLPVTCTPASAHHDGSPPIRPTHCGPVAAADTLERSFLQQEFLAVKMEVKARVDKAQNVTVSLDAWPDTSGRFVFSCVVALPDRSLVQWSQAELAQESCLPQQIAGVLWILGRAAHAVTGGSVPCWLGCAAAVGADFVWPMVHIESTKAHTQLPCKHGTAKLEH